MKTDRILLVPFLALALLASGAARASAVPADELARVLGHYEAVRQALLADRTAGVTGHATAIEKSARDLAAGLTAERTGVPAPKLADLKALLPQVSAAAARLAAAKDLDAARAAFGELSKPLVRWREMASGPRPVVVYCSMVKKAWLQPEGEIGNPYYGKEMPGCGEIVSKSR
jgi:Cu(I)/Ag(I) efflux system membrane fusion protein